MSIKVVKLLMFIMLGLTPFFVHFLFDIVFGVQIECINYCPEIYFFNVLICAYNLMIYLNKKYPLHKLIGTILLIFFICNITLSTCIYAVTFFKQLADLKFTKKDFILLIVLALFNLIFNLIMEMTLREDNENRYKKDSENRYEKYLLERIGEKSNSIKNSQTEKREEEKNDTINSKGLMNGSDILAEMLKNHIEIQEYFQISKNQSKFSFYFSIASSLVGIIAVVIAAFGMVIFKSLGISIIAAVSGAITEIISGIVLWIHNKSALQLNYYYDSLHENEKFLSAVNIADKLSEEKKEDMYIEIIRKQIDIHPKNKENKAADTDKK